MNVLRVAIIGPESTGKTRIAEQLAALYGAPVVPEVAREWLTNLGRPYEWEDLSELSRLQEEAEELIIAQSPPVLICDTDQTVIRIWSTFKYGKVDPGILEREQRRHYDLTLLTDIDLPWVPDPLRENPGQRAELFSMYYRTMISKNRNFRIIFGRGEDRLQRAVSALAETKSRGHRV